MVRESEQSLTERIYEAVAPVFTPEMGHRMCIARMKLGMDQKTLAEKLGCQQVQISRLELGKQETLKKPFHLAQFKEVFGKLWTYVLLGNNAENMNEKHVRLTYWQKRTESCGRTNKGKDLSGKVG